MNTPAHLIFGAAAFSRPGKKHTFVSAILGGFAPDFSLYAMSLVSILIMGISPQRVFDELYFSDAWQQVFAIDNSFVIWCILFAIAMWRRSSIGIAFAGAALLHLALDFPLHTEDARMHFWPISNWVFHSPFSYWQGSAGARIVGPIELVLSTGLAAFVFWRFKTLGIRITIAILLALEWFSSSVWYLVF